MGQRFGSFLAAGLMIAAIITCGYWAFFAPVSAGSDVVNLQLLFNRVIGVIIGVGLLLLGGMFIVADATVTRDRAEPVTEATTEATYCKGCKSYSPAGQAACSYCGAAL